jgi:microcystin-dependent protein
MADPFLGEIKLVSFNFPPKGWAFCNGQLLAINQNQALFSILGTTYGGDGRVNFGLPNLQGRMPVHAGSGITLGERAGETAHTLTAGELPQHTHLIAAQTTSTDQSPGAASIPGGGPQAPATLYSNTSNTPMNPAAVSTVGGNQPHDNMSPYLVLNFIIALQGIFPSQT